MLPEPEAFLDAAAAISDGRAVDWDALVRDADDEDLRRRLVRLRRVAEILRGHDALRLASEPARPDAPSPALRAGFVLGGRYRLERRLGTGGMGDVWLAFDLKLGVDVALKAVRSERATSRSREALRREVRAARQIVSPHVCRLYDLVEIDGAELISMEAIDGEDLARRSRERGPMREDEAGAVAAQMLAGLQAIHDAGIVHRDLKPSNVMVTPAGRVVVMDFGVARDSGETPGGAVAGTPAYMAPEQRRGEPADARSDLYAAALVLLELVHPGPRGAPREGLPAYRGPWRAALSRALSHDPQARFASAAEFARALEAACRRPDDDAADGPYPGLTAFSEAQAKFFYGREVEVEALVRRLRRLPMVAVVGPSGVGKSSFVRAGVMPSLPESWGRIACSPGTRPFAALGEALASQLAGDPRAMSLLPRIAEPDVAVELVRRWRDRCDEAVVVFDAFEELFTRCPDEVQAAFADLVSRLTIESDVRVVIVMRDDFLFHGHAFPGLRPMLTELTLLPPLAGAELRRALVQPALSCGYRFEDDALADEIVAEVEAERGALPLIAFTASRLWERRDRERGVLTREAYRSIGGVAGSLAQHAEATLRGVGSERIPLVRDLFRCLVTAQGTRQPREREELLSAFPDRDAADRILDRLVESRLLTAFETPHPTDADRRQRHVELVHESLLRHWPRLVRWRTQDADGAQLRDQLRQAAQLWEERGRPEDLLWSGTVYEEYRLWRQRYPGGLTALEEAFGGASASRERKRRRRRRAVVVAAIALLSLGFVTTLVLWRNSERAQALAVAEARRAEAEKLYTLAQVESDLPNAFAYTLAALDLSDQPAYRRHAIKLLLRGPVPFRLPVLPGSHNVHPVEVSPDGRWIAMGWSVGAAVELYAVDGGPPRILGRHANQVIATRFTPDSRRLVTTGYDATAKVWTVPEGTLVRTLDVGEVTYPFPLPDGRLITCEFERGALPRWREWSTTTGAARELGTVAAALDGAAEPGQPDVDPSGRWAAVPRGRELLVYALADLSRGPARTLGRHPATIRGVRFAPDGKRLVSFDDSGGVRLWSLDAATAEPLRVMQGGDLPLGAAFASSRPLLAVTGLGARVWDLSSPGADPEVLHDGSWKFQASFDPGGRWLLTAGIKTRNEAWPLGPRRPVVLSGTAGTDVRGLAFDPSGRWLALVSHSGCELRRFPLDGESIGEPETLFHEAGFGFQGLHRDDAGATLATAVVDSTRGNGTIVLVSLPKGDVRTLPNGAWNVAVDATGRRVAAWVPDRDRGIVRVFDSGTGADRDLGTDEKQVIGFARDGRVLSRTVDGLWAWDVSTRTKSKVAGLDAGDRAQLCPDRETWIRHGADGSLAYLRLDGAEVRRSAVAVDRNGLTSTAVDASCDLLVFGRVDGDVEIVRASTGERRRLPIHDAAVNAVAIDPLGRWIGSAGGDGAKLWRIPEGTPLPDLPREAFLGRMKAFTNLRAVRDERQPNGYALRAEGLPDWKHPPSF